MYGHRYASRNLTGCEQRYSQTQKVRFGRVRDSMSHVYVYGMKFVSRDRLQAFRGHIWSTVKTMCTDRGPQITAI